MERKVIDFIKQKNMIKPGETIGVATSGGIDSMSLLHFLNTYKEELDCQVVAITVDHMIRGDSSLGDSLFVMTAVDTGMMITRVQPVEIEILQYPIDTLKAEVKDIKPLLEEPFHIREILPLIYLILGIAAAIVGLYFLIKYLRNRPV
jgi:asparagine synthetase B (glutamine-hydrolysing)